MANVPCRNPARCGVQSHLPDTIADCMNPSGGKASGNSALLTASPQTASSPEGPMDHEQFAEYLVEEHGIYLDNMDMKGMRTTSDGWTGTVWNGELKTGDGKSIPFEFQQGMAYGDQTPEPESVMESFIFDIMYQNQCGSVEAMISEREIEPDDTLRLAEVREQWDAVSKLNDQLKEILTPDDHNWINQGAY